MDLVINFGRQAVKQVYDRVHEQTDNVRNGLIDPLLLSFFGKQGVDINTSVFPSLIACDEGVYTGTLISQARRVFEFYFNCAEQDDFDFEDVTEELGLKDPQHPDADSMEVITMSLLYFDQAKEQMLSA